MSGRHESAGGARLPALVPRGALLFAVVVETALVAVALWTGFAGGSSPLPKRLDFEEIERRRNPMHRRPVFAAALLALALGGLVAAPVRAQQATPEVVDPAQCQVQPRPVEFFQQFGATPVTPATPAGGTNPTPPPVEGQPADQATVEAVTATYRELIACLNAGDYLRAYALYTDNYLRQNFRPDDLNALAATPAPMPESTRIAFAGVREVVMLPDGRVGALVDVTTPGAPGVTTTNTVFARVGDRFLIDEETAADAPAATPAA